MLVEQSSRVSPLTSVSRSVSTPAGSHHLLANHKAHLSPQENRICQVSHSSSDSSLPPDDNDREVEDNDNSSTTTTSSSTPVKIKEEGSNSSNSHHLLDDKRTDSTFSHIQRLQFAFEKNSVFVNYLTNSTDTTSSENKRQVNSNPDHQLEKKMLTKLALTSASQSHHDNENDKSEGISDGEEMEHCELENHLVQTPSTSPTDVNTSAANIFQCPLCSVSCNSRHQFNEHLVSHSQQHACPKCSFLTNEQEELRSHLQQSHDMDDNEVLTDDQVNVPKVNSQGKVKTFKCKQCDYRAVTKMDFWDHSKSHIRQEKMLTCPKCTFVTEYKHHLEYHLRNHFGSKPFQCSKCSYSCVNKSMLNSHLKSHSNVYQYRCSDCSYATKYCHSLKLHLRKYKHNPSMVLNLDGTPNPLPIIDVYGTRRGPKIKRPDSNSHQPEFASLNQPKSRNSQNQQQLVKAICNNNITSNNSSEDEEFASPTSFVVSRDREFNSYDETPPSQNDRSRLQHSNCQRKFSAKGSGSDHDDNESDSDQESPNAGNFHKRSFQQPRHHQMPITPITPTSLGLLKTTLMAHNNSNQTQHHSEQEQQQLQVAAAAAAAMAGKSPLELYAAINQYILVNNPLLQMTPSALFEDVHAPKKNKKSQQNQSLTQILNQSLAMARNGQNQITSSPPPLQHNRHSHVLASGGSIPLDLRNPKHSPILYETPADSTEKRKRKGKAMRYDRKTVIYPLNLSENLRDDHDDDNSEPVAMDANGVLDFSNNNFNNNNVNNLKKSWNRRNTQQELKIESLGMNSPVTSQSLMCKHCEISFPDQILYSMHMSYHSGDFDPFLCKSCGKKTMDKTSFFLHLTTDSH